MATKQQLINDKRQYIQILPKIVQASKIPKNQKQYSIISIIGLQGSGKSTLLNALFKTDFQVLQQIKGSRTTKGIWISFDVEKPILIMDVEGNDSAENVDPNFQKTVAMFALTFSNMLIINIWAKDIGRHTGSQYSILKILMEMSLKLFKQESKKVILFCLRDFNSQQHKIVWLREKIQTDVRNLFDKIPKPAHLQKHPYDKFFKIEIHTIRKFKKNDTKNFDEDVLNLRNRLTNNKQDNYLFNGLDYQFNLPIGDLETLSKKIWECIVKDQKFNLPNEKTQISNFRCTELKQNLTSKFQEELTSSLDQLRLNKKNIGHSLKTLFEKYIIEFQTEGKYYQKKVVDQKKQEFKEYLEQKIISTIEEFAKAERDLIVEQFSNLSAQKDFNAKICLKTQLEFKCQKITSDFEQMLKSFIYSFPQKKQLIRNLQITLKSKIQNLTEKQFEGLKRQSITFNSRILSTKVADLLTNITEDYWVQSQKLFSSIRSECTKYYYDKYQWIFGDKPSNNVLEELQSKLYTQYKEVMKIKIEANVSQKLLVLFSELFFKNQTGITHNWSVLTEQQISDIFQLARNKCKGLLQIINNPPNLALKSFIDEEQLTEQLFEENKLTRLLDDIERKMTEQYEKIIRVKKQSQMSVIPWYYWLIIIFFVYDDLWYGAEFPIIYYPSMIIFSIAGLFFAIGHQKYLFSFIELIIKKLKERFPILR